MLSWWSDRGFYLKEHDLKFINRTRLSPHWILQHSLTQSTKLECYSLLHLTLQVIHPHLWKAAFVQTLTILVRLHSSPLVPKISFCLHTTSIWAAIKAINLDSPINIKMAVMVLLELLHTNSSWTTRSYSRNHCI